MPFGRVKPSRPTKVMSMEEYYAKTDNANKLMTIWYCIASTEEEMGDHSVFLEHWYWNEGEKGKPLDEREIKNASCHTLSVSDEGDTMD